MYLTCPLCRIEWVVTSRICTSCDKIRHYMEIYSQSKILEILDKVLVVQQHKDKDKEIIKSIEDKIEIEQKAHFQDIVKTIELQSIRLAQNKKNGDDQVDYEKPLTRTQKNKN